MAAVLAAADIVAVVVVVVVVGFDDHYHPSDYVLPGVQPKNQHQMPYPGQWYYRCH